MSTGTEGVSSGGAGSRERVAYYDWLKVLGAFMVVMIHVCAKEWYMVRYDTFQWQVLHVYDSLTRWSVPVFFMVSGALFLGDYPPTKKIFTKYIPRMILIYTVWNLFYALLQGGWPAQIVLTAIAGNYQMWFIPAIVGGYLCVPVFRQILKDRRVTEYFLLLALVLTGVMPALIQCVNIFFPGTKGQIVAAALSKYSSLRLNMVAGELVYFLLGRYMAVTEFTVRQRRALYAVGAAGFVLTVGLTELCSFRADASISLFYENTSFTVAMQSVGVFAWFRFHVKDGRATRLVTRLSPLTLGVYLLHTFFLDYVLMPLGMDPLAFNPILAVPVMTAAAYLGAMAVSWLFRKIPVVGKILM